MVFATNDGLDLFDRDDRERLVDAIAMIERTGAAFLETCGVTALDGRRMWMNVMGEPTLDGEQNITGVRGAIQDVTAWKEAEAAATLQRTRFTQLASVVPAIIWTADAEGSIDYFNEALIELLRIA